MRNTVVEKMTTLEFETELRNSWLLWEVSEGWWVGERISQCEIGHWWLQQILRLKLVTFLLWQFRQKFHLYLLMCSFFLLMSIYFQIDSFDHFKVSPFGKCREDNRCFSCIWFSTQTWRCNLLSAKFNSGSKSDRKIWFE